jgi:hypothetical protein
MIPWRYPRTPPPPWAPPLRLRPHPLPIQPTQTHPHGPRYPGLRRGLLRPLGPVLDLGLSVYITCARTLSFATGGGLPFVACVEERVRFFDLAEGLRTFRLFLDTRVCRRPHHAVSVCALTALTQTCGTQPSVIDTVLTCPVATVVVACMPVGVGPAMDDRGGVDNARGAATSFELHPPIDHGLLAGHRASHGRPDRP